VAREGNDFPLAVAILIATYTLWSDLHLLEYRLSQLRNGYNGGAGGVVSRGAYVQERRLAPI
jgi:hypothetical protein